MFLRYTSDDGEKLYEIRWEKTPRKRAAIAEKIYAKAIGERRTWEQLQADALSGAIEARSVALWLAMTIVHPLMRYEDLPDFDTGALRMEYSKQELRLMLTAIERNTTILAAEKEMQLEQLKLAIDEAPAGSDEPDPKPDPGVVEEQGKAETAEPSTS